MARTYGLLILIPIPPIKVVEKGKTHTIATNKKMKMKTKKKKNSKVTSCLGDLNWSRGGKVEMATDICRYTR